MLKMIRMLLVPKGIPARPPLDRRPSVLAQEWIRFAQFLDELGVFHGATYDRIDDSFGDMGEVLRRHVGNRGWRGRERGTSEIGYEIFWCAATVG